MSIRASLCLALALACASTGCVTSRGLRPPTPEAEPVYKADSYVRAGDWRAASAFSPEYTEAQQMEFRQQARTGYQKAIAVDAKHLPAHIGLARLENRCGDYAASEARFQKALALAGQNAGLWSELGQVQLKMKNFTAAVASFQKAADLDPGNKDYANKLAFTMVVSGRKGDAVAVLAKIQGEARACVEIARALHRIQQPDDGNALLARAEQLDPASPELRRAREELGAVVTANHVAPAPAPVPTPAPAADASPAVQGTQAETSMPAVDNGGDPRAAEVKPASVPRPPVITIHARKN